MINQMQQFANWLFTSMTSVWNFCINNALIQFVIGAKILSLIIDEIKKYSGKGG